jgi:dihydropteroate synthase
MQDAPIYRDVVSEVAAALSGSVARAVAAGIPHHRIMIDPGIGFGKTVAHNLALLADLTGLKRFVGCPIALGISRKRFLSLVSGTPYPAADGLGHVLHALLAPRCALLRVHDVRGTILALRQAGVAPG